MPTQSLADALTRAVIPCVVHERRLSTAFLAGALIVLAIALGAAPVDAGCNLIPQAQPAFRGALGTVDRPYAAPGDFIDVNVRTSLCDGASPGLSFDPSHHETGVTQVQLKKAGASQPGVFKLSVKAKRWFTAAAANQPAGSTDLTVTIGTQCFRLPVTKKSD